jgi:transcriptional regulator with XRE-family HTH domain
MNDDDEAKQDQRQRDVAAELRDRRDLQGLSIEEVSARSGISDRTIEELEDAGQPSLTSDQANALAKALGATDWKQIMEAARQRPG